MRNSLVALGAGAGLVGVLAVGGVLAVTADQPPDLGERIVVPSVTVPTTTPEPPDRPTPTPDRTTTTPSPAETGGREVTPPPPPDSDDDDDGGDPGDDDGDDGLDD
jgi:hypothetical protein